MATDRIERDVFITAPARRVWAALTEAEQLASWFGDAGAEVELRVGGRLTFRWRQHGTVHAVIERLEAPRFLSYRWALQSDEEPRPGNSTLVEFSLTDEAGGTRLSVVESGFADLEWPEAQQERHVRDNSSGWASELGELVAYVERQAA
jgi:uncharacterized protein YndB with AHSA1/START domain